MLLLINGDPVGKIHNFSESRRDCGDRLERQISLHFERGTTPQELNYLWTHDIKGICIVTEDEQKDVVLESELYTKLMSITLIPNKGRPTVMMAMREDEM